jgi:hypothetical protein
MMILSLMEIRLPATSRISVEKVMIPSPPSWKSPMMIICPAGVKKDAVSWTISPVTQTAEVEVKRASMTEMCPVFVLKGSRRSTVPSAIAEIKLSARNWAG